MLKPVHTAPTEDAAARRLLGFCEESGQKSPTFARLWENAWADFVTSLPFEAEIGRIVCNTNATESVHARIRRAVRARGHFPSEKRL
ncbi:transposase [Streptomyces sp. NPDC088788]|uniref:transposase n=1 Tax=Streptomyces sp. NPDC088788 TaxID=3365898 RepID=UPI003816F8EF